MYISTLLKVFKRYLKVKVFNSVKDATQIE